MSTKSDRNGRSASESGDAEAFDHLQTRLLSILARRDGEPVTYAELREKGLEFPAGLVSELELAGVEIERCRITNPGGRSVRAVRLPPTAAGIAGLQGTAVEAPESVPRPAPTSSEQPRPAPAPWAAPAAGKRALPALAANNSARRESDPQALAASIPDSGAVRVYRGSLRRAFAARWATLAHRRDAARFAPHTPPRSRHRLPVRVVAPVALLVVAIITVAVVLAAVSAGKTPPPVATHHNLSAAAAARARARTHATRAPAANPMARTDASSRAEPPGAAVRAFYEAAAQHRYAAAWALADPSMRDELGSYAAFEDQMTPVRSITFHQVDALQHTSNTATVAVRTTSVQTDRTQQCWGTVRTLRQAGAWLLDGISIHCV